MNTPSHAILNLALFNQQDLLQAALPIAIGAILPDAPIFVFYFWTKLVRRQSEQQIWSESYDRPFWQSAIALFHSLPLALIGLLTAHFMGWEAMRILCLSMVLHSLLDLPVHNDDAHRHFFPFSNYRFISPLSYWDPQHYGGIVSLVEKLLVLLASIYVFGSLHSWIGKGFLIGVNLLYLSSALYFWLTRPKLSPQS